MLFMLCEMKELVLQICVWGFPSKIDEHSAKLKSDMEQAKSTYTQEKFDRENQLVANRRRQVCFPPSILACVP